MSTTFEDMEVKKMRNKEIKEYIKSKNIPMWRVAEKLGIADSSFSRMLRYEISEEKKSQIKAIADELAAEQ